MRSRVRGLYPHEQFCEWIKPLIRRHSRSSASAFLRTAAGGRLCHLLPQGKKEESAYFAFLVFAFFALAAFFAGFSSLAFFSTFTATGVLAASRIARA